MTRRSQHGPSAMAKRYAVDPFAFQRKPGGQVPDPVLHSFNVSHTPTCGSTSGLCTSRSDQVTCPACRAKSPPEERISVTDESRNGVRVIVTRTKDGSTVQADCQCFGNPGRAHSTDGCPVLKRRLTDPRPQAFKRQPCATFTNAHPWTGDACVDCGHPAIAHAPRVARARRTTPAPATPSLTTAETSALRSWLGYHSAGVGDWDDAVGDKVIAALHRVCRKFGVRT